MWAFQRGVNIQTGRPFLQKIQGLTVFYINPGLITSHNYESYLLLHSNPL